MSKDKLDEFLGKDEASPLETDKIYGGTARAKNDTVTIVRERKLKGVITLVITINE